MCSNPEPLRQYVLPQIVKESLPVPEVLLHYIDLAEMDDTLIPEEMEQECEQIQLRVEAASPGM